MAEDEDPLMVEALMGWDTPAAQRQEVAFYRSRDARGSRTLTLSVDPDGTVQIGGQDLGPGVSRAFGEHVREYEWSWALDAADVERATKLLGGHPPDDLVDVLSRWADGNGGQDPGQFLKDSGLTLGFWNRMGD